MVRKNLKISKEQPSVEEIYGTWMKCIDKTYKTPKKELKSASTKASKEKLSEKLLHEGYPLKKSEKVEKVLDMAEQKREKVSKEANEKISTEATMEKKSEKLESKLSQKSSPVTGEKEVEHPVVLRNKCKLYLLF